ncbi:MAG: ComF family protein [Armatimonadota bacterium]|nr:ComF family protein [Armatimonadota bacterium]
MDAAEQEVGVRAWIRVLGQGLVDLLLPPLCVVCEKPGHGHLCAKCLASMHPMSAPICHRCGRALPLALPSGGTFVHDGSICGRCRELSPAFDACRAYGPYAGALRTAILAVKFGGRRAAIPPLGQLLVRVFESEPLLQRARVAVPVPLHPRRYGRRGFNQSELLARELCRHTGLVLHTGLLKRVRETPPQVGLGARERRENLREAFQVVGPVPGDAVLLVDDVVTTGATFNECASALRHAGCGAVYALALAHD